MRAEVTDLRDQARRGLLDGLQREASLGKRRQRITFGQAGILETQPGLPHAEDLARVVHLRLADRGDVRLDVRTMLQRGIEDAAAFAAGARDDQHIDPFVDISGHHCRTLARLVVGMRVDSHQP